MTIDKVNELALGVIMEEQANCMKDATEKDLHYLMAFNDGVIELLSQVVGCLEKEFECAVKENDE